MPDSAGVVLIVDDQPSNLEVLGKLLTAQGFNVRAVTSGPRAIEAALASPPDLILLDVSMPGMDGYETCRRLQADETLSAIPVLFLTAHDDASHKAAAFESGGRDYITKPFDVNEVTARVRVHVALRKRERELLEQHAAIAAAKEQFEQLVEVRERLSAMLIHDLKSPLTVIGALLDNPTDEEVLDDAQKSYDKIVRLVTDLLTVHKSEHVATHERRERVGLRTVVERVLQASQYAARLKGVELVRHLDVDTPDVSCDVEQLDRVMTNLLENAIKFTPAGGSVTVTLDTEPGVGPESGVRYAVVSVRDTGAGIPAADLPYIFDPYRQRSGTAVRGSVGLGLAIVQRLVATHGGRVRVLSREGVGSEFRVLLPTADRAG